MQGIQNTHTQQNNKHVNLTKVTWYGETKLLTCTRLPVIYRKHGQLHTLFDETMYKVAAPIRTYTSTNKTYTNCVYVVRGKVRIIARMYKHAWRVVRFVPKKTVIICDNYSFSEETVSNLYENPSGVHYYPEPGWGPVFLTKVAPGLWRRWCGMYDEEAPMLPNQ